MEATKMILESKFFTLGDKPITKKQLEWYCKYWWVIQYEFTLGLGVLLGQIMRKIRDEIEAENMEKEELWKQFVKFQGPAIFDEMGSNRDPFGLMHHDLFLEQVRATTSLTRNDLTVSPVKTVNNNGLARLIYQSMFNGVIVDGLCMMLVVETIAPQLFATQTKIFLASGAPRELLSHSILHETLEQQHAEESKSLHELLSQMSLRGETSDESIQYHLERFAHGWRPFLDEAYENLKD